MQRDGRRAKVCLTRAATTVGGEDWSLSMQFNRRVTFLLLSVALAATAWTFTPPAARAQPPAEPDTTACDYRVHFKATVSKEQSRRMFRTYYNSDCTTTTVEVPVGSPEAVADDRARSASGAPSGKRPATGASHGASTNSAIPPPWGAGSGTCVALQTLRDPIGIPETEIRNKHWFAWGGFYVNSASLTVYAVPGKTGWQVDWVSANYYGQYVPATAIQGFGKAQFVWNLHLYRHTQEANTLVYGNGNCDGEFGLTGTVPGNNSYTTHDVHWE